MRHSAAKVQTLGPYELFQRLGSGATAEVFLASGPNPRGTDLVALKVMLENLADSRGTRETFLKEARTSALLRHKHIVEIYEVGEVSARPFIAMELVRGHSLSLLLKKMKDAGETFSFDEACDIVRQASLGLHYIHEVHGPQGQALGLIHRDVSPQNLIIDEQGVVKVVDFGLAKATAQTNHTTGLKGKLRYMAPEQLKAEGLDRRVDVFALGAVLWELVCGVPLHPGPGEAEIFQQAFFNPQPHPDEVKRGLPRALVEVLQAAVHRDKAKRYATAAALAAVLEPLSGVDVGNRIAARVARHFDRLPRSRAELEGFVGPSRPPVLRAGSSLPAPPGRVELLGAGPGEVTEPAARPSQIFARAAAAGAQRGSGETLPMGDGPRPPALDAEDARDTVGTASAVSMPEPPRPRPASGRGLLYSVAGLIGLSLLVAGFAISRRLFPPRPMFEEVATREKPKWKSDLPPETSKPDDGADVGPGPGAADPGKTKTKGLTGRPPKKGGKGKVRFITLEPAEVFLGKRRYGLSNDTLVLPSGRHHIELVVPGGEKSAALDIDVVAGTSIERGVSLESTR